MRVFLQTLGCRLNYAEMAALGRQLTGAGHEVASSASEADLCILNSCAVTGEAARQSRQLARQLARANPQARLIVTGCYATLEGEAVARLPNVTLVVGNDAKDGLLSLIEASLIEAGQPGAEATSAEATSAEATSVAAPLPTTPERGAGGDARRTRAFIKVQDGCRNRCTFCIVTVARGDERSRTIDEVVAEMAALHAEGYQEAVLTGVHLGGYGSDLGGDLAQLVVALLERTAMPRLRLSSIEPFDLQPDFFALWGQSDGRLMPHLHLPAQSGSDAILRRMARRNRVVDFEALVAAARAHIPGLVLTTDLIVGFPGEGEAEFAQTLAFARRVRFAHMHVFPYSPREGTAAANFEARVPEDERKRRVHTLVALDAEIGTEVRRSFLGDTRPVLWEGRVAGRDPSQAAWWSGLTDNYLRVVARAGARADLHNRIIPTRLTALEGDAILGETDPL